MERELTSSIAAFVFLSISVENVSIACCVFEVTDVDNVFSAA